MPNEDKIPNMAITNTMEEKQVEMRTLQKDGRVDIPGDWLDEFDIDYGDNIHLVADPDGETVTIKKASADDVL